MTEWYCNKCGVITDVIRGAFLTSGARCAVCDAIAHDEIPGPVLALQSQLASLQEAQRWIPVLGAKMSPADVARFWAKADESEYCWNWSASKSSDGYGRFKPSGWHSSMGAHRIAYALIHGDFDPNKHICHECDNPSCVNPNHLFLSDHAGNMLDKQKKGRGIIGGQKSSRYTGVSWRNDSKRWRATFKHNGQARHIGCYSTEEEAAHAYDQEAAVIFGADWPHLNFPLPSPPREGEV